MCERHSLSYRPFEFWVALCTGFEQLVVLNKSVVAHRILPAPASKLILKWYEDQCPEPCDFTCEKQTSIKCACSHSGSKSRAYFCQTCTKVENGKPKIHYLCTKCYQKHVPVARMVPIDDFSNIEWTRDDIPNNPAS